MPYLKLKQPANILSQNCEQWSQIIISIAQCTLIAMQKQFQFNAYEGNQK